MKGKSLDKIDFNDYIDEEQYDDKNVDKENKIFTEKNPEDGEGREEISNANVIETSKDEQKNSK